MNPTQKKPTQQKKASGIHYQTGPFKETIELIEDVVTRENIPRKSAYAIGNAIKYLLRVGKKQGEDWQDDVEKAENYLHRARTGEWNCKR